MEWVTPPFSMTSRHTSCLVFSAAAWYAGSIFVPWPAHNLFLSMIFFKAHGVYLVLKCGYTALWLGTSFLGAEAVWIMVDGRGSGRRPVVVIQPVPHPSERDELSMHVGDSDAGPVMLDDEALSHGTFIVGAKGTGKTVSGIYQSIHQLLSWMAGDQTKRLAGFILEVKGDLVPTTKTVLAACGRLEDYVEIGLGEESAVYNPLSGDLDPQAIAFGIGSLIENTFGKGREPYWRQASESAIRLAVRAHQAAYEHVTLRDIYRGLADKEMLSRAAKDAIRRINGLRFYTFTKEAAQPRLKTLLAYGGLLDEQSGKYRVPHSNEFEDYVSRCVQAWQIEQSAGQDASKKGRVLPLDPASFAEENRADESGVELAEELESMLFRYERVWTKIEPKLRESITETCNSVIEMFDEPKIRRMFCPTKEEMAEQPARMFQGFSNAIEMGKVVCINFPSSQYLRLAKIIGTMAKLDFERAVLDRSRLMAAEPARYFRHVAMIMDECQETTTAVQGDMSGDDHFLAMCRQPKCIPVLATTSFATLRAALQEPEMWHAIVENLSNKVFLRQDGEESAKIASGFCGSEFRYRMQYGLSETGANARLGLGNRVTVPSRRSGITASKTYVQHEEPTVRPTEFMRLPKGEAVLVVAGFPRRIRMRPFSLESAP
jgi:hypothetical protein